jgi:hypothetical protein
MIGSTGLRPGCHHHTSRRPGRGPKGRGRAADVSRGPQPATARFRATRAPGASEGPIPGTSQRVYENHLAHRSTSQGATTGPVGDARLTLLPPGRSAARFLAGTKVKRRPDASGIADPRWLIRAFPTLGGDIPFGSSFPFHFRKSIAVKACLPKSPARYQSTIFRTPAPSLTLRRTNASGTVAAEITISVQNTSI